MPKFKVGEKLRGIMMTKERRIEKLKEDAYRAELLDALCSSEGWQIIVKPRMQELKLAASKRMRNADTEERQRLYGMLDFYEKVNDDINDQRRRGKQALETLKTL